RLVLALSVQPTSYFYHYVTILLYSLFFLMLPPPPTSTLFPYTTLFRSEPEALRRQAAGRRLRRDSGARPARRAPGGQDALRNLRSEEHTSELQSPYDLVCRLLLEKKKKKNNDIALNIEKNTPRNVLQHN